MPNEFAARLIRLRGDKNLTQQELGDAVGISPSQISRYEAGQAMPRKTVLRKLAEALNVTILDLAPDKNHMLVVGNKRREAPVDMANVILKVSQSLDEETKHRLEAEAESAGVPVDAYILSTAEKNFIKSAEEALEIGDLGTAGMFRTLASVIFGSDLKIIPKRDENSTT